VVRRVLLFMLIAYSVFIAVYRFNVNSGSAPTILRASREYVKQGKVETAQWGSRFVLLKYPLSTYSIEASSILVQIMDRQTNEMPFSFIVMRVVSHTRSSLFFKSPPYFSYMGLGLLSILICLMVVFSRSTRFRAGWIFWLLIIALIMAPSLLISTGVWPFRGPTGLVAYLYCRHSFIVFGLFCITLTFLSGNVIRHSRLTRKKKQAT